MCCQPLCLEAALLSRVPEEPCYCYVSFRLCYPAFSSSQLSARHSVRVLGAQQEGGDRGCACGAWSHQEDRPHVVTTLQELLRIMPQA